MKASFAIKAQKMEGSNDGQQMTHPPEISGENTWRTMPPTVNMQDKNDEKKSED